MLNVVAVTFVRTVWRSIAFWQRFNITVDVRIESFRPWANRMRPMSTICLALCLDNVGSRVYFSSRSALRRVSDSAQRLTYTKRNPKTTIQLDSLHWGEPAMQSNQRSDIEKLGGEFH